MHSRSSFWNVRVVLWGLILAFSSASSAQDKPLATPTIVVTVTDSPQYFIPSNFTGISFESDAALPNHRGVKGYFFSSQNKQLLNLFINSGIRSLRIGGGTVDIYPEAAYDRAAIDSVFSFAKAAGIKVIFSLPFLNADAARDAQAAKYIWTNYRNYLDCFSIGNEPNCPPYKEAKVGAIKTYEEYLRQWRSFAATIIKEVPLARFTGPDSGGWNWTEEFARDEKSSGLITVITHHQYPGGRPVVNNVPYTARQAIDSMLSPRWLTGEYQFIYDRTGPKVAPYGFGCRLTEANDFLGGIAGASNAMASALWALDYMHWQAARGLVGINFHNNQWLKTCTITLDSSGEIVANPKAAAIRAFDIVSGGRTEPVSLSNPAKANVTTYAIKKGTCLYVTIINKEHSKGSGKVHIVIPQNGHMKGKGSAMFLAAPGNDAGATSGITLGGAGINNKVPWNGKWVDLNSNHDDRYEIDVAESSAVIVRMPVKESPGTKGNK